MRKTILEMKGITKYIYDAYGKPIRGTDVKILHAVDFDVREQEVHILVGENGAGKSTLMKILGGIIPQDEGSIRLFDKDVHFTNPRQSQALGVGFVHQELDLCLNLDVAQNLFLGREIGRLFSDKREMYRKSREMLEKLGFHIDPSTRMRKLSTAQQQMVEIVKAVSYNSKIIIMDEPTASLTQAEIDHLFDIIRQLKQQGVSIVYISHRFEELKEIGDRLTVLRDGGCVGTIDMAEFSHDCVVNMMVGRTLSRLFTCGHQSADTEMLRVEGLRIAPNTDPISITVNKGEIVGIGGLVGAGRSELAKSIFGARRSYGGNIFYQGTLMKKMTPQQWIDRGLMYLTEDRKTEGLVLRMSIENNITLASLKKLFPDRVLRQKKERAIAQGMIDKLRIVCRGPRQIVSTLSGGNQQKVVLAKWLSAEPKVLILDEPTRGVDIGAKAEIYEIIDRLACDGIAVIIISSELPELLNMSDRIYVMRRGSISAELHHPENVTQEEVLSYTL